ncbi:MAG: DMT family transporter [bacterium]|nr:DMT family transporter [bacterium]
MTSQRSMSDWLMFLGLVLFWGSSFALTKIAVETIPPLWVMALRLVLGAVILFAMMRLKGLSLPMDRASLLWFSGLGLIGSVLPFYLISWGSLQMSSGLVGIMMALMPLMTIILSHFMLADERMDRTKLFGFTIGFIGLIILVGPQFLDDINLSGSMLLAQLAIFLAASAYALHTVIARKSPQMSAIQKSTGAIIAAAVIGLVMATLFDPLGIGIASISSISATLALGIFPTALAALLLFQLIDRTGTSFMPLSNYLIAPFAYFFGIATLGEPFELRALVGLMIILVGIYIAERGKSAG